MQVIRSLKRALQPAVTDVSVEFKVPPEFEVLQSPKNLPPVFNGEKMVVYAITKQQGAPVRSTEVSGTAVLKGSILGKVVEHSVSFTFLRTPTEAPALPSIHHLAGKALIRDWEDDGKSKEEIVKLSVDSSVISSHTAFIAVDEESTEPVSGAMKTWDIQADIDLEEDLLCMDAPMQLNAAVSCIGGFIAAPFSSRSTPPLRSYSESYSEDDSGDDYTLEECEEEVEFDHFMSVPPSAPYPQLSQTVASTVGLSSFIIIQQANGSWKLDSSIAQLLGKSLKDLEEACPTECQGTVATMWATILVLSLLRVKYSNQQEEWELVAMKAESWVKRQTLPSGISLEDLYKASEKVFT